MNNNSINSWMTVSDPSVTEYLTRIRMYSKKEFFSKFRSDPNWIIWEDGSRGVGELSIKELVRLGHFRDFMGNLSEFKKNDLIGSPILHKFENVGYISSSTIQYAVDTYCIKQLIQRAHPNKKEIKMVVEIGGGFGGLCRSLSTLVHFEKYILIDLPEVLNLAKMYLDYFPEVAKKVQYISAFDIQSWSKIQEIDLLIACASMAELNLDVQKQYSETLVSRANCAYIAYNTLFRSDSRGIFFGLLQNWVKIFEIKSRVGLQGTYLSMSIISSNWKRLISNIVNNSTVTQFQIRLFLSRLSGFLHYKILNFGRKRYFKYVAKLKSEVE